MELDFQSFLLLIGVLISPAIVVFIIMTIMRVRRGKFHRQRITKKSNRFEN